MTRQLIRGRLSAIVVMAFALLTLITADAVASHLRGTTISWAPTGVANQVRFTFKYAQRRTASSPLPVVGGSFSVGMSFGDNTSGTATGTVTSVNIAEDWFVADLSVTHTYAGAGPYTAFYEVCCRIGAGNTQLPGLQLGHDDTLRMETTVRPTAGNSSPVASMPPIIAVPIQGTTGFVVTATDLERDTLRYRLSTNAEMFGVGVQSFPFGQPPGLSINSTTGQVTWNTAAIAAAGFAAPANGHLWAAQFMVEDLDSGGSVKSKIPIDLILKFVTSIGQAPTLTINPAGPFSIQAGTPVTFTVTGNDADANSRVTLNATGLPFGSSASNLNQTLIPPVTSTFTWTPTTAQGGSFVISFTATDDTLQQALGSVSIFVENNEPPVVNCPTVPLSVPFGANGIVGITVGDSNGDALIVKWKLDGVDAQTDNVAGSQSLTSLTLTRTFGDFGPHTVQVTVTDTKNATASCSASVSVVKADQTITFGSIPNLLVGDSPYTFSPVPSATSNLPVSLTILSGPDATATPTQVAFTAPGVVTIRASQGGNANYNAAPVVDQTFNVSTTLDVTSITLETRQWNGHVPSSSTDAVNTYFSLPLGNPGYAPGPKTLTVFDFISNHRTFFGYPDCPAPPNDGLCRDIGYHHHFAFNAPFTGPLSVRMGADFGGGGTLVLDGVELQFRNADMWWAGSYGDPSQYLFGSVTITAGAHTIDSYGFEGCCDGGLIGQQAQYSYFNGPFITFTAPANAAPFVTLTGSNSVLVGTTNTYNLTVADPDAGSTFTVSTLSCGMGGDQSGPITTTATGGSFACSFPNGPTSPVVSVMVTDNRGAQSNIASLAVAVNVPTVTTVSSSSNPSAFGEAVTLTAHVRRTTDAVGPAGSVTFSVVGGSTLGTTSLNAAGDASITTAGLSVGPHDINVTYAGGGGYNGSAGIVTQVVNKADTITGAADSPDPTVVGQPYTVTVSVSAMAPGAGVPTGTVAVSTFDGSTCTAPLSGGTGSCQLTATAPGVKTISATYSSDTNFKSSTSTGTAHLVNPAFSATVVTSNTNPSTYGQAVTFTATVSVLSPGSGTPTGTVTFLDGVATLGTATLSGGQATFVTPLLSFGAHSITATYGGDSQVKNSTSPVVMQTVNKAPTTTSLASSLNPSVYSQSVTFTAKVSGPSPAVPRIIGHWTLDEAAGSTSAADTSGSGNNAVCVIQCPAFGSTGILASAATFNGSNQYLRVGNSIAGTFTASAWIKTTQTGGTGDGNAYSGHGIIWSDIGGVANDMVPMALVGNRLAFGTGENGGSGYNTITSSVAINTGNWVHVVVTRNSATGAKQIYINGVLNVAGTGGTGMLNANGIVAFGSNPLDNRYFNGAIDDVQFFERVLDASEVESLYTGGPAGTVTFSDDATVLGTSAIGAGGVATFTTSALTVGTHSITASYGGATNYLDSTSSPLSQEVIKAAAIITVNGFSGVYDGVLHGASGSAKGVNNENLTSLLHLGLSFTDVPGGTAHWTFEGNDSYDAAEGDVLIEINKADATIVVSGYEGVYDAQAHGASGGASGVGEADLSGSLNLGDTFVDVPGGTAHWTFTGGTNYNDANGDVAITINKANATVVVTGYEGTYDAQAHGATGSASGVAGVNLTDSLDLGATFTDGPGGTAHWTFTGGTNYNDANGNLAITINKADATIVVNGYEGTYDAQAHGATGSATGVNNADLNDLLHLGASFTNVPGGTAAWTFDGSNNYKPATASVSIIINQAATTSSIDAPTITYAANGVVTVSLSSAPGPVIGTVSLSVDGSAPQTQLLSGGSATFTLPSPSAGDHALSASYAAQGNFAASTASNTLHVNIAETATTLTSSPNPSRQGQLVTLTAIVSAMAPGSGIPDGTVTFSDGTTVLATAVAVDAFGHAVFTTTSLALGPHSLTATYSGSSNYSGSGASANQLVFAYPTATGDGTFVIGDINATVGAQVTFWGAQWEKLNSLSGGASPASFKGYANAPNPSLPTVGGRWRTDPGNSSNPPATVPSYVGVIVASTDSKSGSTITGNVVAIAIVRTDAGYAGNPGHAGSGTVVAVIH